VSRSYELKYSIHKKAPQQEGLQLVVILHQPPAGKQIVEGAVGEEE